jgi:alpha-beta hydrolase superfamily lysophospholipase
MNIAGGDQKRSLTKVAILMNAMDEKPFTFSAADGSEVFAYAWRGQGSAVAVVQIIHGLAEHAGRYRRLAEALTSAGYSVYASDLRGHGKTAHSREELGFFAEHDGWRKCLNDLWQLTQIIAAENPGVPILLLGHSMGAALARQMMAEHGEAFAGVVLSGASGQPTLLALAGRLVARMEKLRLGQRGKSSLIRSLTFGAFNKPFQPARTRFDWLSRDPAEVDKYVADPLCGFDVSAQLWMDMLDAWPRIAASCAGIPKSLPIYVISGSRDPVSADTRRLEPMIAQYRAAGLEVQHKFYPEARHELLNETNREEVTSDLMGWMKRALSRHSAASRADRRT